MRVRPFFWGLFVLVCIGVLALAAMVPRQVPARLSIQLIQHPAANMPDCLTGVDDQHEHDNKHDLHYIREPGDVPGADEPVYGRTVDDLYIDEC